MIQYGIASVSYTDGYGTATFAHPFIDTSYAFFTTGVYVNSTYPFEIITCQKISNNKTFVREQAFSFLYLYYKTRTHVCQYVSVK